MGKTRNAMPLAALAAMMALAGCSGEARRAGPVDAHVQRAVDAVRLDPAEAAATLTAYRASHNLGPVRIDPALTAMAQRQANAMVAANELSHNIDGSFTARVLAAGLDTPRAAENIGGGYYTVAEAFEGWRNSPEHNANLLMPRATRFGIALARDARTSLRVYWAMEVAAPPEARVEGPPLSQALSIAQP